MYSLKKIILYIPSIIFGFFTGLKIFLYKKNILRPRKYKAKIISIGNLIMGGAGKTPTVEYIANYFISKNINFAIISRGYKRKTKGMIVATSKDTYLTIGDEPAQYNRKYSEKAKI
ncbi:MAG: tetraacyldisaccharide 4'-kinase, partial [Bacteroidota bacterium]|nr:tetraacyldisaccharide 4'-kinase [Bacteroidota bacterium]